MFNVKPINISPSRSFSLISHPGLIKFAIVSVILAAVWIKGNYCTFKSPVVRFRLSDTVESDTKVHSHVPHVSSQTAKLSPKPLFAAYFAARNRV